MVKEKHILTFIDWKMISVWKRTNVILGESEVTVVWEVPDNVEAGVYRLGHRGYWHTIIRGNIYYEGWSQSFNVEANSRHAEDILHQSREAPTMSNSGNSLRTPFNFISQWLLIVVNRFYLLIR